MFFLKILLRNMKIDFFIEISSLWYSLLLPREEWQARPPKKELSVINTPVPYVVIQHSYIPPSCTHKKKCSAAMREMQNLHMDKNGWSDIGYNFCVGGDGIAYEGRGWTKVGAHSLHFNSISIGICLIGDWRTEIPPSRQLKTTHTLITIGVIQGFIRPDYKLVGHRQVSNTESPGEALFQEIRSWEHYSYFPRSHKDLVNVKELSDTVKLKILSNKKRNNC